MAKNERACYLDALLSIFFRHSIGVGMRYQCFDLQIEDKIAHLVLNRPDAKNTMQPVFWRELEEIVAQLQQEGSARVLLISSTGKHFSAGMSLDVFASGSIRLDDASAAGRANIAVLLSQMQAVFNQIEALRMPVIVAVQGGCIGGAFDMACAADIRFCTEEAFFCIQEINIGMVADLGTLQGLPKLSPEGVVHELAYSGRKLGSSRALQLGLVNQVFADQAQMLEEARQLALEIASKPPVAVWGSKQAIHYARDHSTHDALQQMGWLQSGIWQNTQVMEAFFAKQQGRDPEFADLPSIPNFSQAQYELK